MLITHTHTCTHGIHVVHAVAKIIRIGLFVQALGQLPNGLSDDLPLALESSGGPEALCKIYRVPNCWAFHPATAAAWQWAKRKISVEMVVTRARFISVVYKLCSHSEDSIKLRFAQENGSSWAERVHVLVIQSALADENA